MYSRSNPYQYPEEVRAEPLPWAVPTLQRLWFGPSLDDKRCRMRGLLSCLNSDTPLILNTSYVPQHMLVMACVLRYIMSLERPIMRRNELDSFLCQAYSQDLMNVQYLQELTVRDSVKPFCNNRNDFLYSCSAMMNYLSGLIFQSEVITISEN